MNCQNTRKKKCFAFHEADQGKHELKICYKRLWKLLIDRDMKKGDLCAAAGISPASVSKMGKGGHVTTETIMRICIALNCNIGDILEII